MTLEEITDAIHEHMYDELNESDDSQEEKKIRQVNGMKRGTEKDEHGK